MYQDAHLHAAPDTELNLHSSIGRVFLNSTSPEDYQAVKASAVSLGAAVIPFFGLHPWMSSSPSFSAGDLAGIVESVPSAGIGEAGLDNSGKYKAAIDAQRALLALQLALASRLGRPVSLHCVHAWGQLFEVFEESGSLPGRIMLHSFYGSDQILRRLLGYGAYVSISPLSLRNPGKSYKVIAGIPLDRLLIETDMVSGSAGFSPVTHLHELKNIYNVASFIFRIPESELISRVWENGKVFTN